MTEKIPLKKSEENWKTLARNILEKYKDLSEQYANHVERLEREKTELALNGRINRGENMAKISDLTKTGRSMMETAKAAANQAELAANKKEWLHDLIRNDESELLKDEKMTLREMEQMKKNEIENKFKNKLSEQKQEFIETYDKLRNQTRPDLSPDQSELSRRQHAQSAVQERLQGKDDANELADIFEGAFDESHDKAYLKELYDVTANRLRAIDSADSFDALQRVEGLRRQRLLTDQEREQLKRYEQIRDSGDLVKTFANHVEHNFENIFNTERASAEDVSDMLENGVSEFLKKAVERMKG